MPNIRKQDRNRQTNPKGNDNGWRICVEWFFFETLERFNSSYQQLLQEGGVEETDGVNPRTETFAEYWGWFLTLDNLSNNRRELWDYFLEMNVTEFMNTICFYKDKQKWEHEIEQQQIQAMRNGR